jgi:hypothetical protein
MLLQLGKLGGELKDPVFERLPLAGNEMGPTCLTMT